MIHLVFSIITNAIIDTFQLRFHPPLVIFYLSTPSELTLAFIMAEKYEVIEKRKPTDWKK